MTPAAGPARPVGRIRERNAFRALRASRCRSRQRLVTVVWSPPVGTETGPRVAFALSRRVGSAVVRNRIRRRLRAASHELDLPAGDYLVTAVAGAATVAYGELRDELGRGALQASSVGRK